MLNSRLLSRSWIVLACSLLAGASLAPTARVMAAPPIEACPPAYDFENVRDYLDPTEAVQLHIRGMERNHLNSNVENLIRGQTTARPGGDLKFLIGEVPNHHRALQALVRLALRDKVQMPPESGPYTVRCWLHRATVFNPKDGTPFLIFGVYAARLGDYSAALYYLEEADRLLPNDINVDYNLGLVYFELRDYPKSLERAKRAYAQGFPLPGLRQKLTQAGQWRD